MQQRHYGQPSGDACAAGTLHGVRRCDVQEGRQLAVCSLQDDNGILLQTPNQLMTPTAHLSASYSIAEQPASVACAATWWCHLQLLHLHIIWQHTIHVHHQAVRLDAVSAACYIKVGHLACCMCAAISAAGANNAPCRQQHTCGCTF
jgi:hypothetical protein